VTSTSGEVQLLHKAAEVMGPRTDFDSAAHSFAPRKRGLGKAFHYKNTAAVFKEIRKTVPGYDLELTGLLTGGAESAHVEVRRIGSAPYDVPVGLIRSAQDTLFTSGTLGRFCTTIESVPEAQAKS
jgi:hypothetical protein